MKEGTGKKDYSGRRPEGAGMLALRAWMWLAPLVMIAGAGLFGTVAALDSRWLLFGVMVVIGLLGAGLGFLHWWLLYRLGAAAPGGER
jgi:hypothetical protein